MPQKLSQIGELSGVFVVRDPAWREKIFFGGLLLLLVHPVGWPAALGYRKELISRLFAGADPVLPEWRGNIWRYFLEGLKAMGVIFGYLSPLYFSLIVLLLANGVTPDLTWLYAIVFFFVFMIFSTLSFPVALLYWTFFSDTYRIPQSLFVVFSAMFALIIFFIPSGFLQVSKTGKYMSAFDVVAAFSTMRSNFKKYLLAWYRSIILSLSGHFVLPFAPWGVVWCYLGIIFEFNSILVNTPEFTSKASWYERLAGRDEILVETTRYSRILKCMNAGDTHSSDCLVARIGPILIPLPKFVANFLSTEAA